jgi:hypothetical protein
MGVAEPVATLPSALSVAVLPPSAYSSTCWPALHSTFPPPKALTPSVCTLNWVPVIQRERAPA